MCKCGHEDCRCWSSKRRLVTWLVILACAAVSAACAAAVLPSV